MHHAVGILLNARCVAHLYFLNPMQQKKGASLERQPRNLKNTFFIISFSAPAVFVCPLLMIAHVPYNYLPVKPATHPA